MRAIGTGSYPMTALLLELGANPNAYNGGEPILAWYMRCSVDSRDTFILRRLLLSGAKIDSPRTKDGRLPFAIAAEAFQHTICYQNEQDLQFLLAMGADATPHTMYPPHSNSKAQPIEHHSIRRGRLQTPYVLRWICVARSRGLCRELMQYVAAFIRAPPYPQPWL
jgi:ankyrin repeat protein